MSVNATVSGVVAHALHGVWGLGVSPGVVGRRGNRGAYVPRVRCVAPIGRIIRPYPSTCHAPGVPTGHVHPCGPWAELEDKMGRKIRGVRVCQNEECRLPQNRDRTGAANIGLQFCRLYEGKSPIRTMTDEDLEFHRLNTALCVACD